MDTEKLLCWELKNNWLLEEKEGFKGWDFTRLDGRWEDEKIPWDYKEWVMKHLKPDHKLLDMGTGGGEFLLTLGHPYENTFVTEAWEPNVKLCKETLEPLGICVKQAFEDEKLPFEDSSFDIIINRHESYHISEIKRLLKQNGLFITQPVGGKNNEFLSKTLIPNFRSLYPDLSLDIEAKKFSSEGFDILFENEYFPFQRFFDVGAIVFYAKIMEWEFPGFTVDSCFDRLCSLQGILSEQGYIESFEHRFMIVAQNNK
ncbi:class I SAM-dependent methyltransferase [Psychrobacillus sp. FSL H8-0484]|uniref:class I SAM-dependent methyltransferase n=1 Tax=Psychrobacillus sp. FSL H8-0484 TaxID=2921390 RepID=UPI0030F7DB1E